MHLMFCFEGLPEKSSPAVRLKYYRLRKGLTTRQLAERIGKVLYMNLLTSGKLNSYLADIGEQAEDMFSRLVKEMVAHEGVTEQLKAENQMEWVGRMNNIHNRATELVNAELIYN